MAGRTTENADYRYGFNGKEIDNLNPTGEEPASGGGPPGPPPAPDEPIADPNSGIVYDYGFRIYNPTIAKFLSVDPLSQDFAMLTPYQYAANMPIWAKDIDGLEAHLTNQGVILGPIDKKNFSFAIRLDEKSTASEISDDVRKGSATFSTLAGGMKALSDNLNMPKVKPALKVKYFKDINGQKFTVTYGERGNGRLKVTGVKIENPVNTNLKSAAKSIGRYTFYTDLAFLGVDAFEASKELIATGEWNNEETGQLLFNSAGTVMGYFYPITGGIFLLRDITLAKDGEKINRSLQQKFLDDYNSFRNSDMKKADAAKEKYYEYGGELCLDCKIETEVNPKQY